MFSTSFDTKAKILITHNGIYQLKWNYACSCKAWDFVYPGFNLYLNVDELGTLGPVETIALDLIIGICLIIERQSL